MLELANIGEIFIEDKNWLGTTTIIICLTIIYESSCKHNLCLVIILSTWMTYIIDLYKTTTMMGSLNSWIIHSLTSNPLCQLSLRTHNEFLLISIDTTIDGKKPSLHPKNSTVYIEKCISIILVQTIIWENICWGESRSGQLWTTIMNSYIFIFE